jgi:hypothetical protein
MSKPLTSLNHVILNAFYEWFGENGFGRMNVVIRAWDSDNAYLNSVCDDTGVSVINMSMQAIRDLKYTDEGFSFSCKSGGVVQQVEAPWHSLLAVQVPLDEMHTTLAPFPGVEAELEMMANNGGIPLDLFPVFTPEQKDDIGNPPFMGPGAANDVYPKKFTATFREKAGQVRDALMKRPSLEERTTQVASKGDHMSAYDLARAKGFTGTEEDFLSAALEMPSPLLDFGDLPTTPVFKGPSRYKGPPKLTLLQGGKQ